MRCVARSGVGGARSGVLVSLLLVVSVLVCAAPPAESAESVERAVQVPGVFTNPVADSADPTIVTDGGFYYLTGTSSDRSLRIWKSSTIAGLRTVTPTTVWTGPTTGLGCCRLWSPVLEKVRGRWYIYLSVTDDKNPVQDAALYALRGSSTDPLGPYEAPVVVKRWHTGDPFYWERGIVGPAVTEVPDPAGGPSRLYLSSTTWGFFLQEMSDPLTLLPGSTMVSIDNGTADYSWEGGTFEIARPFVHVVNGQPRVYVPYTSENHASLRAGGGDPCWSFCIGLLWSTDMNLTDPASWTKAPQPVFTGGPNAGLYRILALATFKSPDGTEDWMVYNGNDSPGTGFGERDTFVQKFSFDAQGMPQFGQPIPVTQTQTVPSGEAGSLSAILPGQVLLDSDFSSTSGWQATAGDWALCSGVQEYCANGSGTDVSVAGELRWANYVAETSVVANAAPSGSSSGVGLLVRSKGSSGAFYEFDLRSDASGNKTWVIAQDFFGNHVIASGVYNWTPGKRYWLRVGVNEGKLTALISVDGSRFTRLAEVEVWSEVFATGMVGLRKFGPTTAHFDSVRVLAQRPSWGFYGGEGWPGVDIDSGGGLRGGAVRQEGLAPCADVEFCVAGSFLQNTQQPVETSGVTNPLPAAHYQTERWNSPGGGGGFYHVIPGLTPGRGYTVRLHFAELHYTAPNQRKFSVDINGVRVLTNFDKVAVAGGPFKATVREFTAIANPTGHIVIHFVQGNAGVDGNPTVSGIQVRAVDTRINAAGPAVAPYVADTAFQGGLTLATTTAIATDGVRRAAPTAVYQNERWNWPGNGGGFQYRSSGLHSGGTYTVRLHFAEVHYNAVNQRKFHVDINGTRVLTNFDKVAAAGGPFKAIVRDFTAVASPSGEIVIDFLQGNAGVDGNPTVSAIEIQSSA